MGEALKLTELVAQDILEELRRLFYDVTGVPLVFTDAAGNLVTAIDEPLCFCGALVCGNVATVCLRRKQWDVPEPEIEQGFRAKSAGGNVVHHRCAGGFRDAAAPIEVEGQTIGFSVFARSLIAAPDLDRFRQLARDGGMPAEVGEAVAAHALIMAPERIDAVGRFLQVITGLVASAAYDTLRARRVLELEQRRDDMLHMIVHDLRTPLTSIIGGLQTVVDTDYDPDITHEFVPMAISGANTLVDMVSSLLDLAKLEAGEMTLDLAPMEFAEVATVAMEQVRGLAGEHGHSLAAALDEGCSSVPGDAEKIRRVLINLMGNAIKFTPDGGKIIVGSKCDGAGLTFWVQDNGPGIPAEYRARIFEKYGQVKGNGTARKNSTGLGLTFCKLVAEAHGGRIWIESEVGKGSTFLVWLPGAMAEPGTEVPG